MEKHLLITFKNYGIFEVELNLQDLYFHCTLEDYSQILKLKISSGNILNLSS